MKEYQERSLAKRNTLIAQINMLLRTGVGFELKIKSHLEVPADPREHAHLLTNPFPDAKPPDNTEEVTLLHKRLSASTSINNELHDVKEALVNDVETMRTTITDMVKRNTKLRGDIELLEDKVAGYELGLTPAEVEVEVEVEVETTSKLDLHNAHKKEFTLKGTPRKSAPKLPDEKVWLVRRLAERGWKTKRIAKHTKIRHQTVYKILSGANYGSVPPEPPRKPITIKAGKGVITNGK